MNTVFSIQDELTDGLISVKEKLAMKLCQISPTQTACNSNV